MAEINLSPYTAESAAIDRRRKMAEVLQAQSMQPLDSNQMAGGWVVPVSPYAGLAKMLQGYKAGAANRQADQDTKDLITKQQTENQDTLRRAFSAGSGSPERPAMLDPQEREQMADQGTAAPPNIPAVAPNRAEMARILSGSNNPAYQAMGLTQMGQDMENQRAQSVLGSLGIGSPQASPTQALMAQQLAGGAAGPTNAAAATIGQPNGGFNVDPIEAKLIMAAQGNPALMALAKAQGEGAKPHAVTEGGALMSGTGQLIGVRPKIGEGMMPTGYGPNGELLGLKPIPGYIEAHGGIKGAEQAAESAQKIETVKIGGREVSGTREQLIALMTGQAPTDAVALSAQRLGASNGLPSTVQGPAVAPTGVGGSPRNQNPTLTEQTYDTERAKSFVKMADEARTSWSSANSKNGMLDQLEVLFKDPNIAKGGLAESFSDLKGIASSLNIDIAGKGAEDAIRSITNKLAMELRSTADGGGMPGAMSDGDRLFLKQIPPSLAQTPAGRAIIMQSMRLTNDRAKEAAEMAQRYEEKHGRLDIGFQRELREWSNKNPLFNDQQKAVMQELIKRGG